ncbi:unnamed protein product (macronuclear) [Paramecium tetraurelia]|uniref:Uncharacterized protein n=1 Tax=Paramecium tetraurelia TaxID=5888 RepID=A0D8T2_PARTE|nr:uncharacterized protein GSPATT00014395001 [Paramecium tetraurelia]CAK79449.1 unnamed protein product [Paramecium tetraurelia]|eukprot:XP_001446846.1 hypothetical protein (macronuclear) [Paramecium tetraurelia strain d4-2]
MSKTLLVSNQVESQAQEDLLRNAISSQVKMAQRVGFNEIYKTSKLTNLPTQLPIYCNQLLEFMQSLKYQLQIWNQILVDVQVSHYLYFVINGQILFKFAQRPKDQIQVPHSKAKMLIVLQELMNQLDISI